MSSVKTRSICMCPLPAEVFTHLYKVLAGFCQKCELHNFGDVPGDNLWSDSIMGDSGSLWGV